jgi:hypothetical protein
MSQGANRRDVGLLGVSSFLIVLSGLLAFAGACALRDTKGSPDGGGQVNVAASASTPTDGAAPDGANGVSAGEVNGSTDSGAADDGAPWDGIVAQDNGAPSADTGALDAGIQNEFCPPEAGPAPVAPPPVINFDTLPSGQPIGGSTSISSQYPGVVFSSADCGGPITYSDGEASSSPNFLVGYPLVNNIAVKPIAMDLGLPVSKIGITLISVGASVVTTTAYDSSHSIVATISVTHPGTGDGQNAHDPITLAGSGIVRVVFEVTTGWPPPNGLEDGFGIDDVTF